MSFDPLAFIELWVVLAFVAAWLVLEWQGRRLDRRRDARDREQQAGDRARTTHSTREMHVSHEGEQPPG